MKKEKRYLFPADYMADPSVHIFDGKIYIYPSHDWEASNVENDNGDQYIMKDYHVLSIDGDPMTGTVTDHGCVLRQEDIPWAGRQLWDCDVQEYEQEVPTNAEEQAAGMGYSKKVKKYVMYFPLKDRNDVFHWGTAIADNPAGPFIPQPAPVPGSYSIDMCAFKDDADGEVSVYFGGLWGGQLQRYKDNIHLETPHLPEGKEDALPSRCVRLTKDGMNFAESPRPILVVDNEGNPLKADDPHRFFEASWMHKYNGKYYFSYSTGDSHLLCYATGDNPYGPFTYQGVILTPVVGWTTHHAILEYKGKWYLFHHDSVPSGGKSWLRSLKVCEIEYDADGKIQTIEGIDE